MSRRIGLPEGQWLWRRLYVFGLSGAVWLLLLTVARRVPPEAALALAQGLMNLLGLILVLYLVAPTAQQLVELAAAVRLRLGGGR